jgi:spermidine synthase
MQRTAVFSIWVAGFSALTAQMLLIRELTTVFYGNELFLGWILFAWLLGAGLFSFILGRAIPHGPQVGALAGMTHSLLALLLPLLLVAARAGRGWVGMPIALPDLPRSMFFAFAFTIPITLCSTTIFLAAVKSTPNADQRGSWGTLLGTAYMHETLGFVGGGMLYGYVLVLADSFRTAAIIQWLNVAASGLWYAPRLYRRFGNKLLLTLAAAAATFVTAAGPEISRRSLRYLFPGQEVLAHQQSVYGPFAITRLAAQHNFYQSGALIGSDENAEWNEQLVHLTLLCHPSPRRVLLIGGGLTGALNEILKHHPTSVDYVEWNPALLHTARAFLPGPLAQGFEDPRVRVIAEDGRAYLNRPSANANRPRYDVILISMADPTSLLLNRYFTVECMEKAKNLLAPDGLFATHLSFSPDFVSADQVRAAASVYRAMRQTFRSILVLPEYAVFFIATPDGTLNYDPRPLIERWTERALQTSFVNPPFLEYRLTTDRNPQAVKLLEQSEEPPNRDTYPRAMFLSMVRWIQLLHPRMAAALARIGASRRVSGALLLSGAVLVSLALFRGKGKGDKILSMCTISFNVMASETTLLLLFQIVFGYLYYRMSLVIAAVMLGMATGSWTGTRWLARGRKDLAFVHAAFALLNVVLLGLVWKSEEFSSAYAAMFQLLLIFLAWLVGLLGGLEFALANQLLFERTNDHRRSGWIYGADLLGSCAGVLLTSLWLLPILGWLPSLFILAALNAGAALALLAAGAN